MPLSSQPSSVQPFSPAAASSSAVLARRPSFPASRNKPSSDPASYNRSRSVLNLSSLHIVDLPSPHSASQSNTSTDHTTPTQQPRPPPLVSLDLNIDSSRDSTSSPFTPRHQSLPSALSMSQGPTPRPPSLDIPPSVFARSPSSFDHPPAHPRQNGYPFPSMPMSASSSSASSSSSLSFVSSPRSPASSTRTSFTSSLDSSYSSRASIASNVSNGSSCSAYSVSIPNTLPNNPFLPRRPAPPDCEISVDDTSPDEFVVKVYLPGFSMENICVALKRHGALHILADSYDAKNPTLESSCHFERMVELGPEAIGSVPKAKWNGNKLRVHVPRKRTGNARSSLDSRMLF